MLVSKRLDNLIEGYGRVHKQTERWILFYLDDKAVDDRSLP